MQGVVVTDYLVVYKDPNVLKTGVLKRGDHVEITDLATANWWYVKALDKPVTGWVDKRYIQLKAASAAKQEPVKVTEQFPEMTEYPNWLIPSVVIGIGLVLFILVIWL